MYVLSGVPPSKRDGAGDFLLYLIKAKKIKVIWKPTSMSRVVKEIIVCTYNRDIELVGIIIRAIGRYVEYKKNRNEKEQRQRDICLFHFQSIGYEFTREMIKDGDIQAIFLVDNCYFCIKAYNWKIEKPVSPCVECLDTLNSSKMNECKVELNIGNESIEYNSLNKELRNFNGKVFAQNEMQYEMAKHFFIKGKIIKTGMISYTLQEPKKETKILSLRLQDLVRQINDRFRYIILVHAHGTGPKGMYAVKIIAKRMKNIGFIIPYKIDAREYSSNCYGIECKWNTGLRELCISADIVLVPSVWSVPIEGALIKSMKYGKRVIAISNTYDNYKKDFKSIDYIDLNNETLESDIIKIANEKDKRKEMTEELIQKTIEWGEALNELDK